MKGARLQSFMMAQSAAAKESTSNPPGRGISKSIWQKLRENAMNKTEFRDISQQSKLLPELRTGSAVHPQLETVDFYRGERMSDDEYIPQTFSLYREQKYEHSTGYRKNITLENILENFNEGQISFVGQAGSGKTTLLKEITRQVIEGKYKNLSSIEVVHFVHLRIFRRNDLVTPAEFLFRNVTPEMSDADITEAMQYAKENPNKVLFVIDSLDTVPYTIDGVYTSITTDDRASPEAILFHLLSGNLLPGCRFITSSREYAIRNYKGELRAKQVIALAGFTKKSIRKIVTRYVGEEEGELKMTYFKRKPVIKSLCATPVWLIFTLMVLSIESKFTPTTMAGILVVLLQNMIRSEHVRKKNIEVVLGKLGNMAFAGTEEHRVEFSLGELRNFHLSASDIHDLMMEIPTGGYLKLIQGDSILMYVHQCLQEILSAVHIAKMNLKEFKDFISKYIHEPHYAVVRRLLAGILLNGAVFAEAESFLGDATDFVQKKQYLKKSFEHQLKSHFSKEDRLELYICLSETGDEARDIIQNKVHEFDFRLLTLSPSEMHCIGWVMSQQTVIRSLNLSECNLTQASLSALYHAIDGSNVQLHELNISENERLGPDEMTLIAKIFVQCKAKVLNLSVCRLKLDALKSFLHSSEGAKLHELNISNNKTLGPNEMALIAKIFIQRKAKVLKLRECELKSDALKSFLESSVGAKLHELDVCQNTLGPDEMMVIAQICKQRKVDRLRANRCTFLSGALKSFLLHSVGAKISLLDIGGTTLHGSSTIELPKDGKALVGKITKQCGVETLVTENQEELKSIDLECFKMSTDNFKINKLECGSDRTFVIVRDSCSDSVSKFLPYVTKKITLIRHRFPPRDIEILQNRLDEGRNKSLQIIFKQCVLFDSKENEADEIDQKVLGCREPPAENVPGIVEDRRAELNSDGSITVSWRYPDEDPDAQYHVETFCNDQPTGDIEICRNQYYEFKTFRPSQVYSFKILVVASKGLAGIAMFTNEVLSRPFSFTVKKHFAEAPEICYTAMFSDCQAEKRVNLKGEIKKNGNQIEPGSFGFADMWKPKGRSILQAVHQHYRADDRVRKEVGSQRRRRDEASTSTEVEHDDQVPYGIPEHRTIPKEPAESPSVLPLVKKIHPSRNHGRSNQNQSRISREETAGRQVLEEAQQEYYPFHDLPHISSWREDESLSEAEERLPRDESEPIETSPMVTDTRGSINPPFLPIPRGNETLSVVRPQLLHNVTEPMEIHPRLTVAEIHTRQNFNLSNFDEPSTSRRVPPNTGGIMISKQSEQYYYGGLEGSSYQGYRQMQMGYHGLSNTTGSQPFRLGLETALRPIVDVEEARRQAPPPEIPDPKLVIEKTKIRVSWEKVDEDRVTYCVNIYCNNQLINNTPMKTPKTEIEYPRLKPSCEYQCEVWTCNSRGFESAKTWSNAVNTPNTQECMPSEDGSRGGRMLSQLVYGQGASLTFQNSTIVLGGWLESQRDGEGEEDKEEEDKVQEGTSDRKPVD